MSVLNGSYAVTFQVAIVVEVDNNKVSRVVVDDEVINGPLQVIEPDVTGPGTAAFASLSPSVQAAIQETLDRGTWPAWQFGF